MLQSLLDDFAQSNVETAATLVEAAGRFLYSLPETRVRMSNMLEASFLLCGRHTTGHLQRQFVIAASQHTHRMNCMAR